MYFLHDLLCCTTLFMLFYLFLRVCVRACSLLFCFCELSCLLFVVVVFFTRLTFAVRLCFQVHLAKMKGGAEVAVKVQRAGLKALFDQDLQVNRPPSVFHERKALRRRVLDVLRAGCDLSATGFRGAPGVTMERFPWCLARGVRLGHFCLFLFCRGCAIGRFILFLWRKHNDSRR